MMCRAIWYHWCNVKNVKNTYEGVLLLIKLEVKAWSFTKSNTPPWVFFTFLKLYKWYQIAYNVFCTGAGYFCYIEPGKVKLTQSNLILKNVT